ncbi:MAG TPA: histidine phosphatase family protein [Fimbriimonadaceae bacterium]|nr:histidine phosphatase family protein [Fimbriimonadaceae bacterium]HRJ33165.1 histidine phosphatase family protein [Fimbriimonadaceae bacterium]
MRLYLIRHGQTAANERGVAQGHLDEPLDEVGLHQARLLADHWTAPLDEIWSSDLTRCRVTAGFLASQTGAPIQIDPRLRERSFGELEGRAFAEVRARLDTLAAQAEIPIEAARPEGGESTLDVWNRLDGVLEQIQSSPHRSLAIVSHGGTCATLLARLIAATPQTLRSFRFGNTAVTELRRTDHGVFHLVRFAETPHLVEPSRPMVDDHAPSRS